VAPTAQQSLLDVQVIEFGSNNTLGASMLPKEAKAQPGPDDEFESSTWFRWCTTGLPCGLEEFGTLTSAPLATTAIDTNATARRFVAETRFDLPGRGC
jgi:hypothetical protein